MILADLLLSDLLLWFFFVGAVGLPAFIVMLRCFLGWKAQFVQHCEYQRAVELCGYQRTIERINEHEARNAAQILRLQQELTRVQGTESRGRTRENPPGITLPNPYKTAFTSQELFAQQADMTRHDVGLQSLLNAVLRGLCSLNALPEWSPNQPPVFVLNFSSPATSRERRYVFKFTEPVADLVEVRYSFDTELGIPVWSINSQALGETCLIAGEMLTPVVKPEPPRATADRTRVILLDENNG